MYLAFSFSLPQSAKVSGLGYGFREATYAAIEIIFSSLNRATAPRIKALHGPLRVPVCRSCICGIWWLRERPVRRGMWRRRFSIGLWTGRIGR